MNDKGKNKETLIYYDGFFNLINIQNMSKITKKQKKIILSYN